MKKFEERKQDFKMLQLDYRKLYKKKKQLHLYDEKTSREIYEKIKINYINLFNELKEKFELI